MSDFKVGDWVVHETKVCQIKEMEDGRVTGISDGNFLTGGHKLICFPLTLENKCVAENSDHCWGRWCNEEPKMNGALVHRKLVELTENIMCYDEGYGSPWFKELDKFIHAVDAKFHEVKLISVNGIYLFK